MKKIEAIVRKTKFEEVKEALLAADINWFEYHNVHGIGQSRQERIYRGGQYSTDVIERVALTIVCRDQFVDPTVAVILKTASTGFLLFFGIKKFHGLRVGKRVEEEGLDIYEHGESCYNA